MRVFAGADHDGIELIGMVEQLSEVNRLECVRMLIRGDGQMLLVHVAQGGDILGRHARCVLAPRLPTPIMAMFSFSFSPRPRNIAGAEITPAVIPATDLANALRVSRVSVPSGLCRNESLMMLPPARKR